MNGVADLSPLRIYAALGLTIGGAARPAVAGLESVPIREWLVKSGGAGVQEVLGPMFREVRRRCRRDARDVGWSRVVRTRSTRRGARQREQVGTSSADTALARRDGTRHPRPGGAIHLSTPIQRVVTPARAGHRDRGGRRTRCRSRHDAAPIAARLTPGAPEAFCRRAARSGISAVCPLFVLDRPLTGCGPERADADALVTGVIDDQLHRSGAGRRAPPVCPRHQQSRWLDATPR
jgi:hypothetical protein